jgi:hypothetical protein
MSVRSLVVLLCLLAIATADRSQAADGGPSPVAADLPIWIDVEKPQLVTVVIEDADGIAVRNLAAELHLPAGRHRLSWDGYDNGQRNAAGDLVRNRVAPGTYRARGLTHDGLTLVYEFTVYSGGNPPWPNQSKTGGWLADHSSPLGAVFLPANSGSPYGDGAPQVLLTALVAEAGSPLVWVGLDGQTLQRRQVWGWDGAIAAAYDSGKPADPEIYAYMVLADRGWIKIRGLKQDGSGTEIVRFDQAQADPKQYAAFAGYSLAVHDGLLVFNAVDDGKLVFADVATRTVLGTLPMPKVRGLLFDAGGRLLIASDRTVTSHAVTRPKPGADGKPGLPGLSQPKVLIEKGLDEPHTLAFNPARTELYVADWGSSHQVKVFTPAGKPLRVIGKPSTGDQVGLYDELKMQQPLGLAIDDRDQLWIAEADHLPKRISVWNARTGALQRAHYGPPRYGGGGTIDATDKTRMFYRDYHGLMEFALDWKQGTAKPKAICVRGGDDLSKVYGIEYGTAPDGGPSRWGFANERSTQIGGRTYLTATWQGELRGNDAGVTWMLDEHHVAWPVARIGGDGFAWPPALNQAFYSVRPKTNGGQQLIAWSDRNGNHKVDADEYQVRTISTTYTDPSGKSAPVQGFVMEAMFADLSMTANWGLHVPPPTFDARGIPAYDLSKASFLVPPDHVFHFDEQHHWGLQVLPMSGGWTVAGMNGWKGGRKMWSYPTATHAVPMQGGTVSDITRLLGPPITATSGEAGDWFAMNGERGNIFLMTSDGLYLQTLGGDMRNTPLLRLEKAIRGTVVDAPGNHISFEDEHFHPTITQTREGEVYLVAGKEHSSVFRVTGLSSVRRRRFEQVVLDAAMLSRLPAQMTIPARTKSGGQLLVGVGAPDPVVDGKVDEYATWAPIGSGDGRSASVLIGSRNLYAAWRTGDPKCLVNGGGDHQFLFKRGGCVDLMIQTDVEPAGARGRDPIPGDIRLLVTTVDGATKAVLYRPVVPGTEAGKRVRFESPIGSTTFDAVVDVSRHVTLARSGGDVEIAIPLEVLGLKPVIGREVRADMGLLRGDGSQTIQRLYWSNTDTLLVSDIPSEARLQPANWGTWKFSPPISAEARPAVTPKTVQPGLRYGYHEGKWERLPDFSVLQPASSGVATSPRLEVIEGLGQSFGLEFSGFVRVPSAGVWTFTLTSDDGSRLWIGDTLVVDNDGQHAPQDVTGPIRLAAGLHPIRIRYFENGGGKTFQVRWSGPSVHDQLLPAEVLVHSP